MENRKYWIMLGGEQKGPLSATELMTIEGVTAETPMWYWGLSDWTVVGNDADLLAMLESRDAGAPVVMPSPPVAADYATVAAVTECDEDIKGYLGWNIAATVVCCIPAGVVGIYYASKVNSLKLRGMYSEAKRASERAQLWCIIAIVLGLVVGPFQMLLAML